MRNLYLTFDWHYIAGTKVRWRFPKILWPSKNICSLSRMHQNFDDYPGLQQVCVIICYKYYLKLYDWNLLDTQDVGLKFALLDAISEGKHTTQLGDTIQLSGFVAAFFSFSLGLCKVIHSKYSKYWLSTIAHTSTVK